MHHAILAATAHGDPGNLKLFLGIGFAVGIISLIVWAVHR